MLHTGQHYDYEMSRIFFEGFNLPKPKYHLELRGKTNIQQTADILVALEGILHAERPTCTLVYGDVNSTVAAALASVKLRVPVVHIEGGVRSSALYNPEEINRRVTDHISALIFACTRTDYQNLLREGFADSRIVMSGDIVKDVLMQTLKVKDICPRDGGYVLVTIHREENVESSERLGSIAKGLILSGQRVIFPIHPRTRQRLRAFGLLEGLKSCPRIRLFEPQGYIQFIRLLAGASRVLTDSGGVRREAYIVGKPIIVPIGIVWFPEILDAGWMAVVEPPDADTIARCLNDFEAPNQRREIFGDGYAHRRIVDHLIDVMGKGGING